MSKAIYQQIFTALNKATELLIISHHKPDGDTIGSALAMAQYCEHLNKPYRCFCIDQPAEYFQFLPKAYEITNNEAVWLNPKLDVIITVHCADLKYAGIDKLLAQLNHPHTLINIDHHVTNPGFGNINLIDSSASSACEVIYHLLNSVRAINRPIATCLMTGLITDTGSFSNLATTASAVNVAAELLAKGANLPQISKQALQHRPYNTLKLWGRALERLHEDPKTGMIVTAITLKDIQECEADEEAVSGIANFLNTLDQAAEKIILVLTQSQPGMVKGSLRTTNALLDVTEFAKLYGGGGHKKAAGFSIAGNLELTTTGYAIKPT